MSYDALAAPFTVQIHEDEILARYPQRLSASELGALGELRAGQLPVNDSSYDALRWCLALRIENRRLCRQMIAEGAKTRDVADRRRIANMNDARQKRPTTKPTREQRPKIVGNETKAAPEDALLAAVEATA